MAKSYPRLTQTIGTFPHTDNGDVWRTESPFDYHVWDVDTVVTVLHASWDAQYLNVVDFSDREKRDAWFDTKKGDTTSFVLTTQTTLLPSDTVRLPIPYDVLMRYNYLWVEMPALPVPNEDADNDRKFGFFINDVSQIAPSTTECRLSLDYWTTFIDSTSINYMMLERGHAPMAAAPTPSQYLTNPLDSSELLLTPDVDFGTPEQKRTNYAGGWYLFDEGTTYAVFATNGRIFDTNWGTNDEYEIPGVFAPSNGGIAGCDYLGIDANSLYDFVAAVRSQRAWFFESILAVYYIPAKMVTTSDPFDFCGFSCFTVYPQRSVEAFASLNVDAFGYDDKYKGITKLYTSPYSHLEITDNTGKTTEIRIENMTSASISIQDSLTMAGSLITADAYVIGLSGDTRNISQKFTGTVSSIVNSAGYTALTSWDLPQFAVYQDGISRANYKRPVPNDQARTSASTALQNAQASANTANTNALAVNDTNNTNTINSLNTSHDNTHRSLEQAQDNQETMAQLSETTTKANASLSVNNTNRTNQTLERTTSISNDQAYVDTCLDLALMNQQAAASIGNAIMGSVGGASNIAISGGGAFLTSMGSELSSGVSQAQVFSSAYDAAGTHMGLGNLIGDATSAGISAVSSTVPAAAVVGQVANALNNAVVVANDLSVLEDEMKVVKTKAQQHFANGTSFTDTGAAGSIDTATGKFVGAGTVYRLAYQQAKLNAANAEASRDNAYTIAENVRETTVNISNWNLNTGNTNNDNTQATGVANSNRSKSTGDANANRTKDTDLANAQRTYDTAIHNNVDKATQLAKQEACIKYGTDAGTRNITTRPLGVTASIVTESKAAIRTAGDAFLRYGYQLGQAWDVTKWQVMKHFTYWKAADLWLCCDRAGVENAGNAIETILMNGTTVWGTPEEIGRVSIYEN